jgi:POT family proton-dependent oligopeptide transporter
MEISNPMHSNSLSKNTLNQPKELRTLFFVELWERFGFYSVQALLVLYLVKAQNFSDSYAYALFGAYSALIYATPVVGGYLADRLLGFQRSILLGGFLYVLGYFALATGSARLFYPALALLICGNGFFKSCISSLLGTFYQGENDPRRESGFTFFYIGINLGSFIAPIVSAMIATKYGWSSGFIVAGVGMTIGIATAIVGFRKFDGHGLPPDPKRLAHRIFPGLSLQTLLFLSLIPMVILISLAIQHAHTANIIFDLLGGLVAIGLLVLTCRYKGVERKKMLMLLILLAVSVFFWALFFQLYSSFTLFIDRLVDRHFLGHKIPTGVYVAINPFFIVTLGPVLAALWVRLNQGRKPLSVLAKFAFGLVFTGAAFLLLKLSTHWAHPDGMIWQGWIILAYFLQTTGELCLSPIGLAVITALAPANLTALMMGVWFFSLAVGYAVGGYIADLTSIPKEVVDPHIIGSIYSHMFDKFGWISVGVGLVLLMLAPKLRCLTENK